MQLLIPVLLLEAALLGAPQRLKVSATISPAEARPGEKVELRLECEIEKGWHIYAPSFTGTGTPTSLKLDPGPARAEGKLGFPEPKKRREEVLEEDVLYHEGKVVFTQPLVIAPDAPQGKARVMGKLHYQACTHEICELPAKIDVAADLEVLAGGAKKKDAEAKKVRWTISADPARLPRGGRGVIVAGYEIEKGFHIYSPDAKGDLSPPTKVIFEGKDVRAAGEASASPPAKVKEAFGEKLRILEGKGEIRQPFEVSREAPAGKLAIPIKIDYQVCDDSQCIPDVHEASVEVEVEDRVAEGGAAGAPPAAKAPAEEGGPAGNWLGLILLGITSGLFALAMPCTYPMIPITISYFTKQAEVRKTGVLPLALAYGGGIVAIFVLIGLLVGKPIQDFAAHPWTNGVFAALFILFGLSLIGLYEIRLPSSLNSLAGKASGVHGYLGVFLLGMTLVITSFTCSAPLIGVMFAGGAQAKGFSEIVVGMGVFGITMAVPFVALANFPQKARALPRSGEWMHTLKVSLGFIELAAALKFISNVDVVLEWRALPQELFFYLVAAILGVLSLYLLGLIRLKGEGQEIGPARMVFALIFAILTFYSIHAAHSPNLGWIMAAIAPPYSEAEEAEKFRAQAEPAKEGQPQRGAVLWTLVEDDFDQGLAKAREEKKPALINWTGVT